MPARLPLIDALKALASQLIVLHHLAFYGPMADAVRPWAQPLVDALSEHGRLAVQVFLVVAGFLAVRGLAPAGAPAAIGPLALVRDGDLIELDVPGRRLELKVDEAELAARRAAWTPPAPRFSRGFGALYLKHVSQANEGCDFDFLGEQAAAPHGDPEIH